MYRVIRLGLENSTCKCVNLEVKVRIYFELILIFFCCGFRLSGGDDVVLDSGARVRRLTSWFRPCRILFLFNFIIIF